MVKSLPRLRLIDLSWNSSLTDESILGLFNSCPCLHEVTIAGLKRITSKPFLPIISGLAKWRRRREEIRIRVAIQMGVISRPQMGVISRPRMRDTTEYEVPENS